MNFWQSCSDTKDAVPLYPSRGLFLKPVALLHISVQLPQLKAHGRAISNWEIMEKLKLWIQPEEFISLKVSKCTLEFIRFDGEIPNKSKLPKVLASLNGKLIKVPGFSQKLKVRAMEAKSEFPTKHDWDSFFRDSRDMNEMKAGERPDTVYIGNLPCKWFSSGTSNNLPCEKLIKNMFEQFGEVKRIDIPILDPFRNQMNSNISGVKQFTFNKNIIFECYIQFKEYFCFVKCMDAFRGMKLLFVDDLKKSFAASIKVEFDKSKHLSNASVQRRRIIRERLEKKNIEKRNNEMKEREEKDRLENEERIQKLKRRKMREQRRKEKQIEKLKLKELEEMNKKIAAEEYLLLMAQRKLESIRLLGELINRIKNEKELKNLRNEHKKRKSVRDSSCDQLPEDNCPLEVEKDLRYKLIQKFKEMQQSKLIKEKMRLKSLVSDRSKLLKRSSDNVLSVKSDSCSDHGETTSWEKDNDISQQNISSDRRYWQNNRSRGDRSYFNEVNGNSEDFQTRRGRYNRGRRGFGRQGYTNTWRGNYSGRINHYRNNYMMPFVDPMLMSYSHEYYKYLQKITRESKRSKYSSYSRSNSRSYSRSRSRSRSRRRSRNQSRSRSRFYSRSRSRSYSSCSSCSTNKSRSWSRSTSRSHQTAHTPVVTTNVEMQETNNISGNDEAQNKLTGKNKTSASTKKHKKHKKVKKKKRHKGHN